MFRAVLEKCRDRSPIWFLSFPRISYSSPADTWELIVSLLNPLVCVTIQWPPRELFPGLKERNVNIFMYGVLNGSLCIFDYIAWMAGWLVKYWMGGTWPNFLITNQLNKLISQIYIGMKLYVFQTVPLSIVRSFSLYAQQCYMSYRFADTLRAGSGWNYSSILILLASCQQTCMTYTTAVCTVNLI